MLLKTDDDHTNAGASRAASEVLGNAQHRGTRVRASWASIIPLIIQNMCLLIH
jgi:hypothetical protein